MKENTNGTYSPLSFILLLWVSACCTLMVLADTTHPDSLGTSPSCNEYQVGAGMDDITGPANGMIMMGYANPQESTYGIHTRLYSRAFIFACGDAKVVYVSVDLNHVGDALKRCVVAKLSQTYGSIYNDQNILISAQHTHAGPGGYNQYFLYSISTACFNPSNFKAICDGIAMSIVKAHNNIQSASIALFQSEVRDLNINRSPYAYSNNPRSEKAQYDADVDKTMTTIQIVAADAAAGCEGVLGMITLYAVHATSMNNTNRYISGDNRGWGSQLCERRLSRGRSLDGQANCTCIEASSNLGDVSPNLFGPKCTDTGLPCDYKTSTCNGDSSKCVASGPGSNMFESTKIIGSRLCDASLNNVKSGTGRVNVTGRISFIHQYVDMSSYRVEVKDKSGTKVNRTTCPAALGYSFAAGTTDGPGVGTFNQGANIHNSPVAFFLSLGLTLPPSPEQIKCQAPKPIFLNVGKFNFPYEWAAKFLPTQILQIGCIFFLGVPGEFTTMAGRHLRDAVRKELKASCASCCTEPVVVIAGLSNSYSHYVTTWEEYQIQRYEGASTLYGPYTLAAYIDHFTKLSKALCEKKPLPTGPLPPDLLSKQFTCPEPLPDFPSQAYGACKSSPQSPSYKGDTINATFVAGNPSQSSRNYKFCLVEMCESFNSSTGGCSSWIAIATDASWETKFLYTAALLITGSGTATCSWDIPSDAATGMYRISHSGYFTRVDRTTEDYSGTCGNFLVTDRTK